MEFLLSSSPIPRIFKLIMITPNGKDANGGGDRQGSSYKEFLAARQARKPQTPSRVRVSAATTPAVKTSTSRPSSMLSASATKSKGRTGSPLAKTPLMKKDVAEEGVDKGREEYMRLKLAQVQKKAGGQEALEDRNMHDDMLKLQKEQQEQDQKTLQSNVEEIASLKANITMLTEQLNQKSISLEKAKSEIQRILDESDRKIEAKSIEQEKEKARENKLKAKAPAKMTIAAARTPPRVHLSHSNSNVDEGDALSASSEAQFDIKLVNWMHKSGVVDPDKITPRKTTMQIQSNANAPVSRSKKKEDALIAESTPKQEDKQLGIDGEGEEETGQSPGKIAALFSKPGEEQRDSDSDGSEDSAFGQSGLNVESLLKSHDDKLIDLCAPEGPSISHANESESDSDSDNSSEEEDGEELVSVETYKEGMTIRNPNGVGDNATVIASDLYMEIVHELLEYRAELTTANFSI